MSDNNQLVAPDQTEQVEQVETVETETSETTTEEQSQETEQTQEETEGDKPKEKPWFVKRLERQRAQLAEKERQLAIAEQLLQATQAATGETEQQQQLPAQQSLSEADVNKRAQEIVAQQQFNAQCDATFQEGIKAFGPEFDAGLGTLREMGIIAATPEARTFIEAALDTGKAHIVLHHLAQNPDDADRISSLTPTKMAIEMDRIARGNSAQAKPISKAPPPVKPLSRPVKVEDDPNKMSVDEWLIWRNKTKTIR
jgi:hypothetical protein